MINTKITPSREARKLFNQMVSHDDGEGHLTIDDTLMLALDIDYSTNVVAELQYHEWIEQADDGGWILGLGNPLAV